MSDSAVAPRPALASRVAAALRPSTIAWAIPGPIFHKEMWLSGRRGGTYLIRGLYTLALIGLVTLFYAVSRSEIRGGAAQQIQEHQGVAPFVAYVMSWFQFGALTLAAIIFAAPLVCDEKRAGTLGTLLTTPLRAWQIVLGKLASTMLQLVVLALVSTPILLGVRVFGGVTAEFILASQALAISSAVLAGALAIFHSIGSKRAPAAAAAGLFSFLVSQGIGPLALLGLWKAFNLNLNIFLYAALSPPGALGVLFAELQPPGVPIPVREVWVAAVGWNVVFIVGTFIAASLRLRAVLRSEGEAGAAVPVAAAPLSPAQMPAVPPSLPSVSRVVGDRPVYWREAQQPVVKRAWHAWAGGSIVVIALLWAYLEIGWSQLHTQALHYPIIVIGTGVMLLLSIFGSAGQFAGERESRTWDALACTPLTAREIVLSKFFGFLRRQWLVPAVMFAHFALMSLFWKVNPAILLLLPITIAAPLAATAATGVLFSAILTKSVRAAAANFALWVAIWGGIPMVAGILSLGFGNEDGFFAVALFPNALGWSIVTATGLTRDWSNDWPGTFDYYGFEDLTPIPFLLLLAVFVAFNGAIAFIALRLAASRIARATGRRE